MKVELLFRAATLIVQHYRSSNLVEAWVAWDGSTRVLSLAYLTRQAASLEDEEWCELSMAELLAEFPDVLAAETACFVKGACLQNAADHVVFRNDASK